MDVYGEAIMSSLALVLAKVADASLPSREYAYSRSHTV